jgi:hypothetical protein
MDIKKHPWFRGVNWEKTLEKLIPPPWVPNISHPFDTKYYEID